MIAFLNFLKMAPKRKATEPAAGSSINPFIKFWSTLITKNTYSYTHYTQWDQIDKTAMKVFETWYNDNCAKYKHIKHAFNSMCKHYQLVQIKEYIFKNNNTIVSKFWKFRSFIREDQSRYWIYQEKNDTFELVAQKEYDTSFQVIDDELKPVAHILKNLD